MLSLHWARQSLLSTCVLSLLTLHWLECLDFFLFLSQAQRPSVLRLRYFADNFGLLNKLLRAVRVFKKLRHVQLDFLSFRGDAMFGLLEAMFCNRLRFLPLGNFDFRCGDFIRINYEVANVYLNKSWLILLRCFISMHLHLWLVDHDICVSNDVSDVLLCLMVIFLNRLDRSRRWEIRFNGCALSLFDVTVPWPMGVRMVHEEIVFDMLARVA